MERAIAARLDKFIHDENDVIKIVTEIDDDQAETKSDKFTKKFAFLV